MDVALIIVGLVLLVLGGDALVRGAADFARGAGLSPMLIGITLVGFGTSTPELVTSLVAAFAGAPGIAVGNAVGSNIANILLILGIAALLAPVACDRRTLWRDGAAVAGAAAACVAALQYGAFVRPVGVVFLAALGFYLWVTIATGRDEAAPELGGEGPPTGGRALRDLGLAGAGIVGVIAGAYLLVTGSTGLARTLGVAEAVIGLTIVAVGTSLPELAATVAAAARRQSDIAFGNILGSNIFNVLAILGITALLKPIEAPAQIAAFDGWVMLAATAVLLGIAFAARRIGRLAGAGFLLAYAAYIAWLAAHAGG